MPELAPPTGLELAIHRAIASVDDPEYPGISIVDLGLLESVTIEAGASIVVGLVPTFSGCPALEVIAADVSEAVSAVEGVERVEVVWLRAPAWTIERVSADARAVLAERFTVAVPVGLGPARCPRCGSPTVEQSMFGPSRCRAVNRCEQCSETIEVLRG